jgi:hypothetical protein
MVSADTIRDENTLNIEEIARMLMRGEFPDNYDSIIRDISDDDLELLWSYFEHNRRSKNDGGDGPGH